MEKSSDDASDQAENLKRYEMRCQQKWANGKETSGRVFHLARPPIHWDELPDDQTACLMLREARLQGIKRQLNDIRKYSNPQIVSSIINSIKEELGELREFTDGIRKKDIRATAEPLLKTDVQTTSVNSKLEDDVQNLDARLKKTEEDVAQLLNRTEMHRKAIKSIIYKSDDQVFLKKTG
jgi:hypothetical protein